MRKQILIYVAVLAVMATLATDAFAFGRRCGGRQRWFGGHHCRSCR